MEGKIICLEQKDKNRTMDTSSCILRRVRRHLRKKSINGKMVYLCRRDAKSHMINMSRFEPKEQNRPISQACSDFEKTAELFEKECPEDTEWYICAEEIWKHHKPAQTHFKKKEQNRTIEMECRILRRAQRYLRKNPGERRADIFAQRRGRTT